MFNYLLLSTALTLLLTIMGGFIFWKIPPRKINNIYGYRTTMSQKNQDTWNYAHTYFGKHAVICGIVIFIFAIFTILALKNTSIFDILGYIIIAVQAAIPVIITFLTEWALRKKFTKTGQRI